MLNTIKEAIDAIRKGELIIVVDDENRENEGDFVCAAEMVTPEKINFMATFGRGLICSPIKEDRAKELGLSMMVNTNTAMHETAFTISVDLIGHGCTTGISAYDRATGIKALTDASINKNDFAKPGHIFPLIAKNGGVLRRTGHTEATVDLAEMAGFYPAGVLVEILNEDGSMARLPDLLILAQTHNLKIISIDDLVAFRLQNEKLVKILFDKQIKIKNQDAHIFIFQQVNTEDQHVVIKIGEWSTDEVVPVKVFSEEYMHELLNFIAYDWSEQYLKVIDLMIEKGKGLLVIMRHKEKALGLIDSLSNNTNNRVKTELRDLGIGAQIIRELQITRLNLITNSDLKRIGILGYGLEIVEQTFI